MEEMHRLNAMKVVAATLSNLCAIITFIISGAIDWHYCVISMVFAGLGGWVGARFTRRVSGGVLRAIVVTTGCIIATYFFWRRG
jgi:uncharacterized membrane protein YfcA